VARGGSTDVEVCGGAARTGPFPATRDRAGRVEAAFLLPVPHRTSVRAALAPGSPREPVDLSRLASPTDAARGWAAQLRRGMRLRVGDDRVDGAVDEARTQLLLAAQRGRPDGPTVAALEDWGFDQEFAAAWSRAGGSGRRQARRRPSRPPHVTELDALLDRATTPRGLGGVAAELLLCARSMVAWEAPDGALVLLSELPAAWRGRDLDVQDVPTRAGPLSYAVRWHGDRPALLWSAPPGVRVSAPGLDAAWWTDAQEGEALLTGSAA
jgi:hypothetical protein